MLAALAAMVVVGDQYNKEPEKDDQVIPYSWQKIDELKASFPDQIPWEFFYLPMTDEEDQVVFSLLQIRDDTLTSYDDGSWDPLYWIATWCYDCIPWEGSRGPVCWAAMWCYGCTDVVETENPERPSCVEWGWEMCGSEEVACGRS